MIKSTVVVDWTHRACNQIISFNNVSVSGLQALCHQSEQHDVGDQEIYRHIKCIASWRSLWQKFFLTGRMSALWCMANQHSTSKHGDHILMHIIQSDDGCSQGLISYDTPIRGNSPSPFECQWPLCKPAVLEDKYTASLRFGLTSHLTLAVDSLAIGDQSCIGS